MELKDIVCDRKYAEKLKELGVDQSSSYAVFYGGQNFLSSFKEANIDLCGCISDRKTVRAQQYFIATFTAEELLKILPKNIPHSHSYDGASYYICLGHDGEHGYPMAWYEDNDLEGELETLISKHDKKKVCNALAMILIGLIKMKKLTFKEVDKPKRKPAKIREIPTNRIVYERVGKYFYSFKFNDWVIKTRAEVESDSKKGYWHRSKLVKESNGEVIEEICGRSATDLARRVLEFVNNPKMF